MQITDTITTISKLVDKVAELETTHQGGFLLNANIWYRGHADISWELQPTVLREWFIKKVMEHKKYTDLTQLPLFEQDINKEFRRTATSFLPDNNNLTQTYFMSQHHGMATRLLDWSANALVGLFNAVCEHPERDGGIFVLFPLLLLPESTDLISYPCDIATMNDRWVTETIAYLYGEPIDSTKHGPYILRQHPFIIPISPDLNSGRLFQQSARFTLHMPSAKIQPITENEVRLYKIPAESKKNILHELRRLGTNWATLFPDLDHIAKEIRTSWRIYPPDAPPPPARNEK